VKLHIELKNFGTAFGRNGMNFEILKGNASSYGCPYRDWDWHDGGVNFKCLLKGFNTEGYYFDAESSLKGELVFKRDEQLAA
jgi:hypothetical protein